MQFPIFIITVFQWLFQICSTSFFYFFKIALYHGIDLKIDNEVAPRELIDITPLEKYEDPYDFMKDFDLATVTPKEWKEWKNSWNIY